MPILMSFDDGFTNAEEWNEAVAVTVDRLVMSALNIVDEEFGNSKRRFQVAAEMREDEVGPHYKFDPNQVISYDLVRALQGHSTPFIELE